MKKNIIISACASLLFLASCDYNEKNFPGFDELTHPKDVQTVTIDLVDADYKTIAELKANKELAQSRDNEEKTLAAALEAVGKNKYFTPNAQALWYLPAFINEKKPYLSDGSKVTINYNNYEDLPEYLKDFNSVASHDLTTADYKKVWGDGISASFLSPSTVKKIPALLKDAVPTPTDGKTCLVNYAYSETEPSTGDGSGQVPEPTYTNIADVIKDGPADYDIKGEVAAANTKSILVKDETGIILVYLNKLPSFSLGDVVTVSGTTSEYGGLAQFPKTATVTVLEHNTTFAYPTSPKNMTAANMDAYLTAPKVEYVTYEGTLAVSGTNVNVTIEGATKAQGSVQYLVNLATDNKWNNKKVKVTGYLTGVSNSKYVNTIATSVVLADGSETSPTMPVGLVAQSVAGTYTTRGVVSGTHTKGFMLTDGTGNILVYENKVPSVSIGDIVTVSGTTSKRNGIMQFGGTPVVTKETDKSELLNTLLPQIMTGEKLDEYMSAPRVVYASYEGILKIEDAGQYKKYSMAIEGTTTAEVTFSFADDAKISQSLNGQRVIVTGYLLEVSYDKINTMVTSITTATPASLKAFGNTRAAGSKATNSAVYRYDLASSSWKAYKADGVSINVLQPADYEKMGSTFVDKPIETLPIYLKQVRPYAKKDDKAAVVYYSDADKVIVANEFAFDGANWTQTIISTPSTIVFLKTQGTWTEAIVYYACTFLNEDAGGFVIQDVQLGELKKVWSMDKKLGWKASAFSGGNKDAESWIISPDIDLKKSVAPVLKFDIAINYLNGAEATKYFSALVSTDYTDDVTTATWKELTIEGLPKGNSWDYTSIPAVDLNAYKGQTIRIAFRYKSDLTTTNTTEIKNMSVQE